MLTISEIKERATWLIDTYHSNRIREQEDDWRYYKDTFPVDFIKAPYKEVRLGSGTEIVDTPAAHIVTAHPQVFVEATADNNTALERAKKRGSFLNHLADYLTKQSPQPYKEFVKNQLARGEGWIHIVNNPDFASGAFKNDIPLIFAIPDPIVIFGSPDERNGIPDYVVVSYKRYYRSVINRYEHSWSNPKHRSEKDKYVDWFEYWDKDIRYFEADGEAILPIETEEIDGVEVVVKTGIQPNILGVVPFVHAYSGYGKGSPDGAPEELAVSRIRPVKGRILLKTELASSMASQIKLYAHKRYDLIPPDNEAELPADFNYHINYGDLNVMPFGWELREFQGAVPVADAYNYLQMLEYEISKTTPPIMSGMGTGASGREVDIRSKHGLAQYDAVIENAGTAFGTALSLSLMIAKNKDVGLLPISLRTTTVKDGQGIRGELILKDEDIDDFHCVLKLKAADPIEDKAQAQIGTSKWQVGEIDWETNLTKYQGYSLDEAREIMNKTMAERIIMRAIENNPAVAAAALEKLGIETPVVPGVTAPPTGPIPGQPGAEGGPPRTGNIKSIDALAKDAEMQVSPRPPRASPGLA